MIGERSLVGGGGLMVDGETCVGDGDGCERGASRGWDLRLALDSWWEQGGEGRLDLVPGLSRARFQC